MTAACSSSWRRAAAAHVLPVPYLEHQPSISAEISQAVAKTLPWHSLLLQRSLARLRAGLLCFSHLGGRRSSAKRQRCIFCDSSIFSSTFHTLCRCTKWRSMRAVFWQVMQTPIPVPMHEQVVAILGCGPSSPGYGAALAWAGSLDREVDIYWGGEQAW